MTFLSAWQGNMALVLAPNGRDATLAGKLLNEANIDTIICCSLDDLQGKLNDDIGFALITEESTRSSDLNPLSQWVDNQPPWSDLPFILVTEKGGGPERNPSAARILEILGNVTFLERPFHPTTLISVAKTALRGRKRQYEARAHLEKLKLNEEELETRIQERTRELDEQRAYSELMMASVPAGIMTYDRNLQITAWNATLEDLTGVSVDSIVGDKFDHVLRSPQEKLIEQRMRSALDGNSSEAEEVELDLPEKEKRHCFDIQHAPLRDAQGAIIGGIAFFRDITERRHIEEQLRQSQKMETIGHLTGGVAHDFNNLLMAILSNLELLKKRTAGDDKLQKLIGNAMHGAERGAALTQRLLAFARRQELDVQAVDLAHLINNLEDLLQRSAGPQISLEYNFAENLLPAMADRNQLELALLNLTVNARDAMPDGGQIEIRLRQLNVGSHDGLRAGAYIILSVSDTGTGMDDATLKRAIEPFFSTKELGKGTGLGLSMVHGLAMQQGGMLRLRSKPGKGTTAELWLPASTAQEAAVLPAQTTESPAVAPKSTILVVDDDVLIAMSTVDLLEEMGHTVIEANSGKIALQIIENNPEINLLITDHAMPGMTGVELAKAARFLRPDMPILLATGYAEIPENAGIDLPRLGKPYHQKELASQLARLLV